MLKTRGAKVDSNIAISVQNLSKIYNLYKTPKDRFKEAIHPFKKSYHQNFYALKNIDFTIKKSERVGVIGKNGAGKSTLLKIITGVLSPTSGKVDTVGTIASLLELGAGFNPEMTGVENIYLNATIMGFSKEEIESKIDKIITFADIGDFIQQPVKMYSSGMFARLAFSVAINVEPDILIIDEALSVGDMAFQNKCFRYMDNFIQNDKVILFVSHSLSAIRLLCNRVIWLKDGEVVEIGDTKSVTQRYEEFMRTGTISARKENISTESKSNFIKDRFKHEGELSKDAECYISDIKVAKSHQTTLKVETFESLTIEILINNISLKSQSIGLGLAVVRQDGLEITRMNNIRDDRDIILPSAYSTVTLVMNELNLLDGEYYLSFFLSKSNLTESFHKIENIIKVIVETPYAKCGWKEFEGCMAIKHTWNTDS